VKYQFQDDANSWLLISFDVTANPLSKNTVKVETSHEDLSAQLEGFIGDGNHETCTVKFVDGR
jgi:hypothetical protein